VNRDGASKIEPGGQFDVSLHHPLLCLSESFEAEADLPPADQRHAARGLKEAQNLEPTSSNTESNGFHDNDAMNGNENILKTPYQGTQIQVPNKDFAASHSTYYYPHAEAVVLRTDYSTNGIAHRRLEFMPMSLVRSPPPHHPLSIGGPIKARKGMRVMLTQEGSQAFDEQFHNISGGGIGTISKVLNNGMMCKVVWDNDPRKLEHCYRTGRFSRFELALYDTELLASIPRSVENSHDKNESYPQAVFNHDGSVSVSQDQDGDPVTIELRKNGIFPPAASNRQRNPISTLYSMEFEGVPLSLRTSRLKRLFDRDRDGFFTCAFTSEMQERARTSAHEVSGESSARSELNMAWA